MGFIRHNAIVVTSHDASLLKKAHVQAQQYLLPVTNILSSQLNGYSSFLIIPDGSKEGWLASSEGDEHRQMWCDWADTQRYEDGSTSLEWVEVAYGESYQPNTQYDACIVRDAWSIR